jgi:hypothetical protein
MGEMVVPSEALSSVVAVVHSCRENAGRKKEKNLSGESRGGKNHVFMPLRFGSPRSWYGWMSPWGIIRGLSLSVSL